MKGNTANRKTFVKIINDLKGRFHLGKCAIVCDKGLVSKNNLEKINSNELKYIVTLSKKEITSSAKLDTRDFSSLSKENLKDFLLSFDKYNSRTYFKELPIKEGKRFILCFNPEKFLQERKDREEKLSSIEEYLTKFNKELLQAKKSREKQSINKHIHSYLKKRKAIRFFSWALHKEYILSQKTKRKITTYQIKYARNKEWIKKAQILDGVYVICSNLVEKKENNQEFLISPEQLISSYKNRVKIEQTFHYIIYKELCRNKTNLSLERG